jgi:hypothetical protein
MRRSILNKCAILFFLFVCIGCKVKKEVAQQPPAASVTSPDVVISKTDILSKIIAKQADFNTLSIRAKADLDIDRNSHDVTMIIRIQKDKAIWVSVTAIAGLEVARALITPDSIKIRNNLESTYIKKPFSYIYSYTNRQLNFNTLQAIFAGNAMPEFLNDKSNINTAGAMPELSGTLNNLAYSLIFNDQFRVTQTELKDNSAGQTLKVLYGDFATVAGQIIPKSVNITSNAANRNISVNLNYSRIDINVPVDMPFTVPQRFTVKD